MNTLFYKNALTTIHTQIRNQVNILATNSTTYKNEP